MGDAVVLELMSIASGLEMRRRKRAKLSVRFPAVVLAVAVCLSLGAQMVDAERSVIGWIAAAIPALGFLVMVKIALAQGGGPSTAPTVVQVAKEPDPGPSAEPPPADNAPSSPQVSEAKDEAILLTAAREAAESLDRQGRRVSRQALADALRGNGHAVSNARASALLQSLKVEASDEASAVGLRRRFQPQPRKATPFTEPPGTRRTEIVDARTKSVDQLTLD